MKLFRLFTLIFCITFLSSCETLKDLINERIDRDTDVVSSACGVPATNSSYNQSFEIIKEKMFDEERMVSAKRETPRLKCLTSSQIRKITALFSFDEERLTYAKFAYSYCSDPNNYYSTMSSLFPFDEEKMELEKLTRG